MLSAHFDRKQSRDPVDLTSTCHPSPSLTTFAIRSQEVRRLLLDLDSYGALTHWVRFLFLKRTANVLAPRLAVVFRRFHRSGNFLLAGEWLISPKFQRVHLPPQWSITDQFPLHLYCTWFLIVWYRFVLSVLWNA